MPEIRSQEGIITKAKKEGVFTFQASTDAVDSYGDVVVNTGIDLKRFKKNPIILYQHDSNEPIGKAIASRIEDKGLVIDVELAPRGVSEKIDTIRGLLEAGILKAVSIGFTAKEYEPIRNKDNIVTGFKFLKSLLHEVSVVSIPANQEALAIAKNFNLPKNQFDELFAKSEQPPTVTQNKNRVRFLRLQMENTHVN
jgi:HK97 family phage prohead protease